MKKVAINGFGRIGRAFFRVSYGKGELEIVAINDPFISPETARYLLTYDTVYGRYDKKVVAKEGGIEVDGRFIPILAEKDPKDLPWREMGVELVIESTGVFLTEERASLHLQAGAARVGTGSSPLPRARPTPLRRSPTSWRGNSGSLMPS